MSIREPVLVKCEDGRYLEVKLRDIFEEKRPVNPTVYCSPKKKKNGNILTSSQPCGTEVIIFFVIYEL